MKAAVMYAPGQDMSIEDVTIDAPKHGEVLVRVTAAGVCHSDLSTWQGKGGVVLPCILGHEAAGIVEKVGPGVDRVKAGESVVLSWAPSCGRCFYCRAALPTQCEVYGRAASAGVMWDGTSRLRLAGGRTCHHFTTQSSFAECCVMPESGVVPIPASIPPGIAALVGCAVTTGFGASVNDCKVKPGDAVAIWGLGGVGLSALMGAKLAGAETLIVVDPNPRKGEVGTRFGATHHLNPKEVQDIPDAIRQLTRGRGADAALECIGKSAAFEQAVLSIRGGGVVALVGQAPKGETFNLPLARAVMSQQKRIVGSHYGGGIPEQDFVRILGLYESGRLPLDALIGRTLALDEINDAFHKLAAGFDTRQVIRFN